MEQAATLAEGRRVVLLVPARDVFRARLGLPARGRWAAVRGARYALEDRIAGDVEDLHFASGPISGDQLEVAAIERRRLGEWLSQCSQVGLKPVSIHGEGDTLPGPPNAAVALLEQDSLLLRNGGGQYVAAEPGELASLVEILGAELAGDDAAPLRLVIYCDPLLEGAARKAMTELAGREVELRLLEGGVMAHLAAEALSGKSVNLLQGEFRPRDDQARSVRQVALGILAVALLYPIFLGIEGWRAQRDYLAAAEAVDFRLMQLMPGVSGRSTLREEFQRRVASADLSVAASSDEFLRLMRAMEVSGNDKVRVLGLSYGNGSARVQVRAADMETLDEARRRIESSGYSALVQTAAPESNGAILGELSVRHDSDR